MRTLRVALSLLALWPVTAPAADWPGYLGPQRNGVSGETGLLRSWPGTGPTVLWRVPIGRGYSSAAVAGDRLFTMFADDGEEWVGAFDPSDGTQLWRTRTGNDRFDSEGSGPRGTPTVDGDAVYALGAEATLLAVSAATGETLWSHDLRKEFGAQVPRWGVSGSPLVDGSLVMVHGGGGRRAFLAFDKRSGALRWASGTARTAYASPISATIGDVPQAIFFGTQGLVSVARDDGRELWTASWRTRYDVNAATPLFVPDSGVFISSGYDTGAALIQVVVEDGEFNVYQVWRSRVMKNHYNTSVRVGRHLYGFDDGILKCIEVLTGDQAWRGRAGSKGSLIAADGHLLVLGGSGELSLVEATPEAFRRKAEARVTKDRTWAVPALADGVLYVRSVKELIALHVGALN